MKNQLTSISVSSVKLSCRSKLGSSVGDGGISSSFSAGVSGFLAFSGSFFASDLFSNSRSMYSSEKGVRGYTQLLASATSHSYF